MLAVARAKAKVPIRLPGLAQTLLLKKECCFANVSHQESVVSFIIFSYSNQLACLLL